MQSHTTCEFAIWANVNWLYYEPVRQVELVPMKFRKYDGGMRVKICRKFKFQVQCHGDGGGVAAVAAAAGIGAVGGLGGLNGNGGGGGSGKTKIRYVFVFDKV